MVAEVAGTVLMVPLAPARTGDPTDAARSAVTKRPNNWLTNTGESDDPHMTPDEEYEYYALRGKPAAPRACPATARRHRTGPIHRGDPRTSPAAAAAEDRSVSSWIRRAVEHELGSPTCTGAHVVPAHPDKGKPQ
jgi:hypothetical protein